MAWGVPSVPPHLAQLGRMASPLSSALRDAPHEDQGGPVPCHVMVPRAMPYFGMFVTEQRRAFSKPHFCGILKNGTRTFFQNLKFPKIHFPSIQIELILS